MLFSAADQLSARNEADLIVFPFWSRPRKSQKPTPKPQQRQAKPAASLEAFHLFVKPALETGDFEGKTAETVLLYTKGVRETRCLLLGLGKEEELSADQLRQAYAAVVKECHKRGITNVNLVVPTVSELRKLSLKECLQSIAEGLLLGNYRWNKPMAVKEETPSLASVCFIGILPTALDYVKETEEIMEGVYLARDLVNGNADTVTPRYLADVAVKIAKKFPNVKATIFDQRRIEKEKMGLFLAVARGSPVEPTFIILSYRGCTGSKDHTVLIGKGVTFDTGGLNLKPTGSMETMRDDMAGAATVLSSIAVAAALDLNVNVTAVVAATENGIDARSYKPGDVYRAHSGLTVEIGNTDAEGRLTLADALSYSMKHLKPTRLIDVATLTGAMVVALGEEVAGLFSNDDNLAARLLESSKRSSEMLWRLPLHASYKEQLKSDIADLKNVGGRPAGSITAALFLQEFVGNLPWAHIDIAGTAFASKEKGYISKNGVGFGVRTIVDFLQHLETPSTKGKNP